MENTKFPCGECGKLVTATEFHPLEACEVHQDAHRFLKGVKAGLEARSKGRIQPWSKVKKILHLT